jgi:hypothetical protein
MFRRLPFLRNRGGIEHLKVYGERNTGTRFLAGLLKDNFTTPCLSGAFKTDESRQDASMAGALLKDQPRLLRMVVDDKLRNLHHRDHIAKSFGWKHACPPVEYLRSVPERSATTLFIVIVKHPVHWARSFHKRPYHTYFPSTRRLEFHDFLHHVFIPSGRDNVDAAVYGSPIELYAAKVDGYRRLAGLGVPFELVRYEELLENVAGALQRLANRYDLGRRRQDWVIESASTKEREVGLAEYQARYRLDRVQSLVSAEDYEFISDAFGNDRLAWLGYGRDSARGNGPRTV